MHFQRPSAVQNAIIETTLLLGGHAESLLVRRQSSGMYLHSSLSGFYLSMTGITVIQTTTIITDHGPRLN